MTRVLLASCLGIALLAGGCATSRVESPAPGPAPAAPTQAALPATPPVKIAPAASRKVVLTMTGPKNVVEAKDWPAFKEEWRATFADHAKEAGIAFAFADGVPAQQGGDNGTVLQVTVNDYRMIGIGARIFFGVMTGNAYIDARIRFLNLRDGALFGEQQHNTTSSAWSGVFAKVTPQQVDAIASDVFRDIKAAQK